MENGGLPSDDDEEIEEIIVLSDDEELLSKRKSPVSVVACTSTSDDRLGQPLHGRKRTYADRRYVQGSDEVSYSDHGEYGDAEDDDTNNNQPGNLIVTYRSEETNEEYATAMLIVNKEDNNQRGKLIVTFRSEETDEEYATAMLLIDKQDSVDTFLTFIGLLLRSMHSEELKQNLMQDITQIIINAKIGEMLTLRRPRLQ